MVMVVGVVVVVADGDSDADADADCNCSFLSLFSTFLDLSNSGSFLILKSNPFSAMTRCSQ